MAGRRAIFLDRDGTMIEDVGYPRDPLSVRLLPSAAVSLRALADAGFLLVIVSNQSGISRGWVRAGEAAAVHARLEELLAAEGVALDGTYYCPHAPDDGCECRKPSPTLILRAARDLGIDLSSSYVVGDQPRDVEAGRRAGCRTALIGTSGDANIVAPTWGSLVTMMLEDAA